MKFQNAYIQYRDKNKKIRLEEIIENIKAEGTNSNIFWNIVRNYKPNNLEDSHALNLYEEIK